MSEAVNPAVRDYFQAQAGAEANSLRFRLDGTDSIKQVGDILRGGWKKDEHGRVTPNDRYRLLNEEGVARVDLFLRSSVSKINHLSNYKNEERVLMQQRALSKAFLLELVLNMKTWGPIIHLQIPKDSYKDYDIASDCGHGYLYTDKQEEKDGTVHIYVKLKVRNKHIVLQVVENVIYQSFLRAIGGKEAEMTAPNVLVSEQQQMNEQPPRRGGLFGLFGGRQEPRYNG